MDRTNTTRLGVLVLEWWILSVTFVVIGRGSKNRCQIGTLASGNMDQNLRNPPCLILSHTQLAMFVFWSLAQVVKNAAPVRASEEHGSKASLLETGLLQCS